MKKIGLVVLAALSIFIVKAQQTRGKVVYEQTIQLNIQFDGMDERMANMIPKSRTVKYELLFADSQSLWMQLPPEVTNDMSFGEGGFQMRFSAPGEKDIRYTHLGTKQVTEKKELMDKTFIVSDSISSLQWKLTGETKEILGHLCMKAEATRTQTSRKAVMENNALKMEEKEDTVKVEAWVTTNVPVATGPGQYQAQLPGLILELNVNNGSEVYKAVSISEELDATKIKAPTGKKKYTRAEYDKEMKKIMDQMMKNPAGGATFRLGAPRG